MRDPVEAYFTQLRDIHASGAGVAETSYYGPLATLLTDLGAKLKPKVTAIINLRNTGAGIPDGGLFTAQQLKGWDIASDPLQGQLPARGAIEVKGTADDTFATAASEQVARYVERYGLVLVTNLRDFVLVGRSADGSGVRELESCRLATSEAAFWARVATPRTFADDAREGLTEFLRRVLLHNAPLSDPKDVAWFLASYARTARLRLESRHELPALDQLRNQLEESLGLKFEGDKGDHFFRSTLVQTLFYGMFALPFAFTQEGVAMLSSVLQSERAVSVNVQIMRAFVRMRTMLGAQVEFAKHLDELEAKYDTQFAVVFDAIRQLMAPPVSPRKPIGFASPDE